MTVEGEVTDWVVLNLGIESMSLFGSWLFDQGATMVETTRDPVRARTVVRVEFPNGVPSEVGALTLWREER